jgi:diguanylate cyclase (GGDEF)-like protein
VANRIVLLSLSSQRTETISAALAASYELLETDNVVACLEKCRIAKPDLVIVDLESLEEEGLEVCRELKSHAQAYAVQTLLLVSSMPLIERLKGYDCGADDLLIGRLDVEELQAKVRIQLRVSDALKRAFGMSAQLKAYSAELERVLDAKAAALEATHDVTVFALARLADSRDPETGEHLERMRLYTQILAKQLGETGPYSNEIDERFLEELYRASILHDIGKVGIPDSILLKPGRLTADEFDRMKLHTIIGAETLDDAARHVGGGHFLKMAAEIARFHHERFDGTGYPCGLKGVDIPLSARIVAVADVYDALTSQRVYKKAIPPEEARDEIVGQSGRHFDPTVVEAFIARFEEFRKVPRYVDGAVSHSSEVVIAVPGVSQVPEVRSSYVVGGGASVLLGLTDAQTCGNVTKWLSETGYQSRRAENDMQLLQEVADHRPQFVIVDGSLPGMGAVELCRRLRKERSAYYVYILLLCPSGRQDVVKALIDVGVDDFLFEPITKEELLTRMRAGSRHLALLEEASQRPRPDPLTGLATRRLIDDLLTREWRRAGRYRIPVSAATVDIDHFTDVIREYGDKAGDIVLKAVGGVMGDNCRATDFLFRCGFDKFCLIMTETNEHGASTLAERVRAMIARLRLENDGKKIHVTASVGVAQRASHHRQIDELIGICDEAQLVAKQLGGNRVVRHGDLSDVEELHRAAHGRGQPFQNLLARDVMTTPIACLRETDSVRRASEFLLHSRINSVPVVDQDGRLTGIVSEKDLMKSMLTEGAWQRPVSEVMTRDVIAYDETNTVHSIYKFLLNSPIRRVVVVKAGRPTGVISRGTLLRWFSNWELAGSGEETVIHLTDDVPADATVIEDLQVLENTLAAQRAAQSTTADAREENRQAAHDGVRGKA